jgi:hypothetical protein
MLENATCHFKSNKFGIDNFFFILILTLCSVNYTESEYRHHCILKLLLAQKLIKIMKEYYFITLEIELGVVFSKTFHTKSKVTCITPIHSFLHLPALLTNNTPSLLSCFFSEGTLLLIKCLCVRHGTILLEECQPGTMRSSTLAYFTNSPTN